jgi:nicotinamide riboside transporter PnuC
MDLLQITFFLSVFNSVAVGYILYKLLQLRQLNIDDIKFILSSVSTIMQILKLVKNDEKTNYLISITEDALNIIKKKYGIE